MKDTGQARLWAARVLIGLVAGWNLQCALVFLMRPAAFAPSFELSDVSGAAAVRGVGILFVMWNIPYLVALWHPRRHRLSLLEAWGMQLAGLLGESGLLTTLPLEHTLLRVSIQRFIVFDAAGLLALTLAWWLTRRVDPALNA
jgi:hypothetical protein